MGLHVGEQRSRHDQREHDAGEDDEQRRLDDEPPEALTARVQKRQSVGLDDRPDQAAGGGDRADERDDLSTPATPDVNRSHPPSPFEASAER